MRLSCSAVQLDAWVALECVELMPSLDVAAGASGPFVSCLPNRARTGIARLTDDVLSLTVVGVLPQFIYPLSMYAKLCSTNARQFALTTSTIRIVLPQFAHRIGSRATRSSCGA